MSSLERHWIGAGLDASITHYDVVMPTTRDRPTDLDRVARERDAAGDELRAELRAAGAARAAATQALHDANDALADVVLQALRTKLIPVSSIHEHAGIARSRVYQIQAEAKNKATT